MTGSTPNAPAQSDSSGQFDFESEIAKSDTPHGGSAQLTDHGVEESIPVIPGFDLKAVVGKGGCGLVYIGEQINTRRLVAAKFLNAHLQGGPVEKRMRREAYITALLRHRNIPLAIDFGTLGKVPYFVTEYCPGKPLDRCGPLPERTVWLIALQISSALAAVNRAGVIHRDVKPGNIIAGLQSNGQVLARLIDFGLARAPGDARNEGGLLGENQSVGSPPYVAPEQLIRASEVDGRADLYAFGATLYHLLTGIAPHGMKSPEVLRKKIAEDPMPPKQLMPEVSTELDSLIMRLMKRAPDHRPENADKVRAEIWNYLKKNQPNRALEP
ncbi:Serine/threonine-protein kinase PknB [Calycomorphotria hydatis]|uniref:Serine/threonine-protein kinase PknB n=2 Tax=Calycomorphotria hydatis TaxID=2528027 RepID=A0A517T6Z6_9PLAN|nr:Serine/threonine-protein kinase PknB [Calycomorphotria hydatis]